MKKHFLIFSPIALILFISCTACSLPFGNENETREINILSWNVQNIFDDVSDGGEYKEFDPERSSWNRDLLYKRLNRIERVLNVTLDEFPQIILLQEVENYHTLDILNQNVLKGYYPWQVLIQESGQAVNTAILSTIPITSVSMLETGYWGQYKLRSIMEIHLDLNDRKLIIFNNHWKSKSGGSAATEAGRLISVEILTDRIKKLVTEDEDSLILAAGDFNENHDEYKKVGRSYRTALIPEIESVPIEWKESLYISSKGKNSSYKNDRLIMYSPWYDVRSSGSYAYKSRWSKIDHFFLWKSFFDESGLEYDSFSVIKDDILLNDYNYPSRWDGLTEEGYSDHLPIFLKLRDIDL